MEQRGRQHANSEQPEAVAFFVMSFLIIEAAAKGASMAEKEKAETSAAG